MVRQRILGLVVVVAAFAVAPAPKGAGGPANPDFETGNLTGWTVVEAGAFGDGSVADASTGTNFHQHGRFHLWGGAVGGDETGELESTRFVVGTDEVSFLVSGGNDPKRLRVELVRASDGGVVHSQTGPLDEDYIRIVWDVRRWRGERVFFRVVDRSDSGHISLDDVRTVDARRADNGLTFTELGQDNQPAAGSAPAPELYAVDPLRPQFHYTPYQGWINDPNGLIEWRGRHHVFAQHYPGLPQFGRMQWAHAVGADPVHFRDLPVALYPPHPVSPDDTSGIFSGSAVNDNSVLTAVFTLITDTGSHPNATPATVGIATSRDGVTFRPHPDNPVIDGPPAESRSGFRDPKVFRDPHDGRWKMVIGSGNRTGGSVQLYASDDLRRWEHLGVLHSGPEGQLWECPNFFKLGDSWVLVYSVLNSGETSYAVGDFDGRSFRPTRSGTVDFGPDFFAAQHYEDSRGRDLLVGWMSGWDAKQPTRVNGHAGALSVARELFLRADGGLGSRPVSDVDNLHEDDAWDGFVSEVVHPPGRRIAFGDALDVRLSLDIPASTANSFTVPVHASGAERTEIGYDRATSTLSLDTSTAGYGSVSRREIVVAPGVDGRLDLRLLLDRSSVEVFTGDGTSLTARVFPRFEESREVRLEPHGGSVRIIDGQAFRMGSSWRGEAPSCSWPSRGSC